MKRTQRAIVGVVVLAAATASVGAAAMLGGRPATSVAQAAPPATAAVERGKLSDLISAFGTMAFRAHPDGSPYAVVNQARGIYTKLPDDGATIACGAELYRVDERPVLLLCGAIPSFRTLHRGDTGRDVQELNANLHELGYDAGSEVDPGDNRFTATTERAVQALQRRNGLPVTGALEVGAVVVMPEALRIAKVIADPGGSAQRGTRILDATTDRPEVHVDLDPSQVGAVKAGDRARVTLPGEAVVMGTVDRLGSAAQATSGQNGGGSAATIPVYLTLDDPAAARGFDAAPVQVDITTVGVDDALSVPVTALVGKSGGGFAVEVVRPDGRRELVGVKLGLFDTAEGRVQIEGDLHEGDEVVVPSP